MDAPWTIVFTTRSPFNTILIFDELKAGAGQRVEAVDTGPIITPRADRAPGVSRPSRPRLPVR